MGDRSLTASLLQTDAALRAEAERLLSSGLRRLLETYGDVHVVGSYSLQLMVWRDLDIHVVCPRVDQRQFFDLGAGIAELLSPGRMHFRNELVMETAGLPRGLYWGVYLDPGALAPAAPPRLRSQGPVAPLRSGGRARGAPGDERKEAWKIDIWVSDEAGFVTAQAFEQRLRAALTDETRAAILRIKSAVWQHADYRRRFSSADIYTAVIDAGVQEVEEFFTYLAGQRPH